MAKKRRPWRDGRRGRSWRMMRTRTRMARRMARGRQRSRRRTGRQSSWWMGRPKMRVGRRGHGKRKQARRPHRTVIYRRVGLGVLSISRHVARRYQLLRVPISLWLRCECIGRGHNRLRRLGATTSNSLQSKAYWTINRPCKFALHSPKRTS